MLGFIGEFKYIMDVLVKCFGVFISEIEGLCLECSFYVCIESMNL